MAAADDRLTDQKKSPNSQPADHRISSIVTDGRLTIYTLANAPRLSLGHEHPAAGPAVCPPERPALVAATRRPRRRRARHGTELDHDQDPGPRGPRAAAPG